MTEKSKDPLIAHIVCLLLFGGVIFGSVMARRDQDAIIKAQAKEIAELQVDLDECRQPRSAMLRLTAYSLDPRQCNNDLEHTATMATPRAGWTVAVSRDKLHWLGKRVYIEGFGVRKVQDLMADRFENAMDLLGPNEWASRFTPREARVVILQ